MSVKLIIKLSFPQSFWPAHRWWDCWGRDLVGGRCYCPLQSLECSCIREDPVSFSRTDMVWWSVYSLYLRPITTARFSIRARMVRTMSSTTRTLPTYNPVKLIWNKTLSIPKLFKLEQMKPWKTVIFSHIKWMLSLKGW